MMSFPKLLQPIRINSMELRNRVMMGAVATKLGTEFGTVAERTVDFYVERARGGVALIVIENTCIDWPLGKAGVAPLRLDDDKFIISLGDLAEAVHRHGAKIATQLQHTGAQTGWVNTEGQQPIAPSPLPIKDGGMARQMNAEDIERVIKLFAEGARRTKAAGFDAVELHGAHGYILTQFLSPHLNKRTDAYGGDLEGRMRFPLEVVKRVRAAVGPRFPIIYRFSADEHVADGLTLDDARAFARALEEVGVDLISVSAGLNESRPWIFPPIYLPRGCNVHLGRAIKEVVSVPVGIVGRINDPHLAESILEQGNADMIVLGRPLLADPDFVAKTAAGHPEDIIPCLSCNDGCIGRTHIHRRLGCVVNPRTGDERATMPEPAEVPKKVLVVGGGPGGIEAACVAAQRGHRVILCEKTGQLGGQLLLAGIPGFKGEINVYRNWLQRRLEKLWVETRLNTDVTPELVDRLRPDVVVLATGARPARPPIPGAEREDVLTLDVALGAPDRIASSVAVIGGGESGCEVALFLAQQDPQREVTVVEMLNDILIGSETANRSMLRSLLTEHRIQVLTGVEVQEIGQGSVKGTRNGSPVTVQAECIVLATGSKPQGTGLQAALAESVPELYAVGDCVEPGKIWDAVHEGARIARSI